MPKPYPKEFRDDVVAVARKGQAPLKQRRRKPQRRPERGNRRDDKQQDQPAAERSRHPGSHPAATSVPPAGTVLLRPASAARRDGESG